MPTRPAADQTSAAVGAALLCYGSWGLLPLLFQAMGRAGADVWEITGHRAAWSLLWAGLLVLLARQGPHLWRVLRTPRVLGWLALSALAIGVNWVIFLLAVNGGKTLEASLGYYINPLMNMLAGALLFRERISRLALVAIALAAVGVALQTAALGRFPEVSLALAGTFCLYGIIRKRVDADAQTGLFVECLLLTPFAVALLIWLNGQGAGAFSGSVQATILLALAGPATVAPLALFSWAARRIPLSAMAFMQFIAPTLQFVIGVAGGETFTPLRAASFAFIWAGVGVFAYGAWRSGRAARAALQSPA